MIAVEVIVALLVVAVVITGIIKIAGPIADAFADRLKLKFQEIGPEQERMFKERIEALEQQVLELQSQMVDMREAVKFTDTYERGALDKSSQKIVLTEKLPHEK